MTINVLTPINDIAVVENAADTTIDLFDRFDDPRTTGLVAQFELYKTSLAGGLPINSQKALLLNWNQVRMPFS